VRLIQVRKIGMKAENTSLDKARRAVAWGWTRRELSSFLAVVTLSVIVVSLFTLLVFLIGRLLTRETLLSAVIHSAAGLVCGLLLGLNFQRLAHRLESAFASLLELHPYEASKVLRRASDLLARCNDRNLLGETLAYRVPEWMHLSGAQFWIEKWGVTGPGFSNAGQIQFPLVIEDITRGLWIVGARSDGTPFSNEDTQLLTDIAKKAEAALSTVLLIERLTRQLDEIRTSRETMVQSQRMLFHTREEERARLARDLHDGPIQTLVSMNIQLGLLIPAEEPGQVEEDTPVMETLKLLRRQIRDLLAELRQFISALRPPVLDTLGLGAALRMLTDEWSAQQKVKVNLVLPETTMRPLPGEVAVNLYRVVQEALSNIARHAHASEVLIHLSWEAARLSLMVRDNGIGFDLPPSMHNLTSEGHFGLVGIQERVQSIGGVFQVTSAPGQGTTLLVDWQMKTPAPPFL